MPSDHTHKVAAILKKSRTELGLTQSEVAERADMHPNSYAKIERGDYSPSVESLRKIVKALGIDPAKVL